jgi:hypothetical protein
MARIGQSGFPLGPRRILVVLLGALALLAAAPAASDASVSFNVTGKWTCNNRGTVKPIAGARVELWHDISYWFDDKLGSTHTASDGSFNFGVRADSNFDLYAKVVLNDDNGTSLGNWYSFSDWDTDTNTVGSHSGTVGLGTWQISKDGGSGTPKCGIWQGAHNAYANYRQVIGSRPPDSHYSISAEFPCCGTPFTTTDTTRWPSGYQTGSSGDQDGGYSVNFHEFAHSVRHSFDGGFAHFLFDVGRFNYAQNHNLCSNTNQGFAFNEGWAEYWAHTLSTCTSDITNYNYEGNVATALNGLEQCSSRPTLVRVLRENPAGITGGIHSYSEFKTKWDAIVGPRPCLIRPIGGVVAVEDSFSIARLTSEVNKQIAAINRVIASLSRRMTGARRLASRVGGCRLARQCLPGIEKLSDPIALNAEIQQAKLVRSRLLAGLTAGRANFMPDFAQANLYNALSADRSSYERANQAILINGLKSTVQAIKSKSGFNPAESTSTFRLLNQRLSLVTRARNRRALTPSSVGLLFSAPTAPVDAVRRVRR